MLKLVFRSLKGRCHVNQFLSVLCTQFSSGDIRQMALALVRVVHGGRWTQAASGVAGRANLDFASYAVCLRNSDVSHSTRHINNVVQCVFQSQRKQCVAVNERVG